MHRKISAPAALLLITGTSRLLRVLKDDKRAIFSAAAHAQRASDYLHGLQPAKLSEEAA
jgi:antirestriction protein ArdC